MVFKEQKREKYSFNRSWKGQMNKYKAIVKYSVPTALNNMEYYYFLIHYPSGVTFNSLWKGLKYDTFKESCNAAEEFIKNLINQCKKEEAVDKR